MDEIRRTRLLYSEVDWDEDEKVLETVDRCIRPGNKTIH